MIAHCKIKLIIDQLIRNSGLPRPSPYKLRIINNDMGGYFDTGTRELAIPKWSLITDHNSNPDNSYKFYYIAHELAHVYQGNQEEYDHGIIFYEYFNKLCPIYLRHWELTYLPDNAKYIDVSTRRLPDSIC